MQTSPQSKNTLNDGDVETNKSDDVCHVQKRYHEEIQELKNIIFAEIEKVKQTERHKIKESVGNIQSITCDSKPQKEDRSHSKENSQINVEVSSNTKNASSHTSITESKDKVDQNSQQKSMEMEFEWQKRLEEREGVWRARLSAIDHNHKQQVDQLQDKLATSLLQGQEMKKDLESRLEEAIKRFEKNQALMESKVKAAEENSQKLIIDKEYPIKSTSPVSIDSVETIEEETQIKEIPQRTSYSQQPLPSSRRKAFLSEQSRTIQEDVNEIPLQTEFPNNLELKLKSNERSVSENRGLLKTTSKEDLHTNSHEKETVYPLPQIKEYNNGKVSISQNTVDIITHLLEDEKEKTLTVKNNESKRKLIDEESSSSETLTETESESSFSMNQINNKSKIPTSTYTSDDLLLNTETQLTQQSLQCMEALLAANPKIMEQLRADLKQLLNRRLQGLGVDPGWVGLPPATFHLKMDQLAHQRRITAKSHKVYFTLRDKLNGEADALVQSHPTESTTDSLLDRLRKKAAQVINVSNFTRQLGVVKNKRKNGGTAPLAASSPKLSLRVEQQDLQGPTISNAKQMTKIQSTHYKDSLSLSSSTYDEDEEDGEDKLMSKVNSQAGSVKSALRNTMSTGNLAKKKVLFVDQEFSDDKRSMSENSLGIINPIASNTSVASLVQDIQEQLSQCRQKPAHSLSDGRSRNTTEVSSFPLSQILPLSKSGRELLEAEYFMTQTSAGRPTEIKRTSTQNIQPLSHIVKKVPIGRPVLSDLKGQAKMSAAKDIGQSLKLSPVPSLTSISSSLLDVSTSHSPRGLTWDLQNIEEIFKN